MYVSHGEGRVENGHNLKHIITYTDCYSLNISWHQWSNHCPWKKLISGVDEPYLTVLDSGSWKRVRASSIDNPVYRKQWTWYNSYQWCIRLLLLTPLQSLPPLISFWFFFSQPIFQSYSLLVVSPSPSHLEFLQQHFLWVECPSYHPNNINKPMTGNATKATIWNGI